MDLFGKKASPAKERITPHKISLLLLINEICEPGNGSVFATHRHALLLLILNLLQTADLTVDELCSKLNEIDEKEVIAALLVQRLRDLQQSEIGIGDFFHTQLNNLFNTENEVLLTRTSFFGLFVRKMLLLYNKMTFGQILHLTSLLEEYIADLTATDGNNEAERSPDQSTRVPVSSRQAENFLTRQAILMQSHEQAAESPMKLQEQIINILEGAPDLAEAYFVQYLNCVRVGEFSKAMDHLYHYFDRKKWDNAPATESDEVKKERCKRFCYAALNLAILHTHFNHREEALTALQESIRIAQESNDHVCLAHGLRLLYTLNQEGDLHAKQILDRFKARASELKIPYLESLSCLLRTKKMVFDGTSPPNVLNAFNDVNILNSEKSLADLAAITHVQQTACLEFYGKSNLAVVHCQFPLHHWQMSLKVACAEVLDGKSTSGIVNSEAIVRSLCFLASHVYQQHGSFEDSMKILDFAKTIHCDNSKYAKFCQAERQKIVCDRAVLMEDWRGAEEAVTNLRVHDVVEADLRSARLKIKKRSYEGARKELRSILGLLEEAPNCGEDEKSVHEIKANVYLALSELYIAVGDYASCLAHLLECKALCDLYHMENLAAITCLSIVEVQLQLGLPEKAKKLINEVMIQILSHGSLMTRGKAKLLLVRCDLVMSRKQDSEHRKTALLAALSTLDVVLKNFEKLRYSEKIKEVLFYQTFVYNELGYVEKRNQCALQYRSNRPPATAKQGGRP